MEKNLELMPEILNKKCETFAQVLITNVPQTSQGISNTNMAEMKVLVKEAMTERNKDEKDIEDRKKNIILFNVPESREDTAEKRKNEDIFFFTLMHNSICDSNLTECITARRLGKRNEDNVIRPLLISVGSEFTKRKFFSRLYLLKDHAKYSSINVSHDMTKDERKQTKELVEKAKKQTQDLAKDNNNTSKNWAYKVRGPP